MIFYHPMVQSIKLMSHHDKHVNAPFRKEPFEHLGRGRVFRLTAPRLASREVLQLPRAGGRNDGDRGRKTKAQTFWHSEV